MNKPKNSDHSELINRSEAFSHKKVRWIKYGLLLLLAAGLFFLISESSLFANPDKIKGFILNFGVWAPLILILLQALQSMISIIPSQVTTIAAGFLFGPVLGLVYSLIGATIGSSVIFLISRKYGKKLAMKIFPPREILHFEAFMKQKRAYALLLARVAPIFPNDLVSFIGGLTGISLGLFTLTSSAGFVVQMVILVFFGSQLANGSVSTELIVLSILIGVLVLIVLFKQQIKKMVIKDLHKVEKSLKQGIKIVF